MALAVVFGLLGACSAARPFEESDRPFDGRIEAGLSPAQTLSILLTQAENFIAAPRPLDEETGKEQQPHYQELVNLSRRISELSRHPELDLHPSERIAMEARAWFLTADAESAQRAALEDLRMLLGAHSKS